MSGKGKFIVIIFMAVALLSTLGFFRLFALRFENGDMFPSYSSLRSDPLGCKALFIALERSSGLEVSRNFRNPDKLKGTPGRTIYWLGAAESLLDASSEKDAKVLEELANGGNRLVIAFGMRKARPVATEKKDAEADEEDEDEVSDDGGQEVKTKNIDSAQACTTSTGAWGIELGSFDPPSDSAAGRPQAALSSPGIELPATIRLHSRHHFQSAGKDWRALYSYKEQAIVLERTVGKGSIVLMVDSYLFSNEAMRNDRNSELLAWLQGTSSKALFDESHLGVYDNPGVMALIKKHRLVPFLLVLLALAALYVWKNAVTFVYATTSPQEQRERGRDNFSGLINLLRRNIAPSDLLNACFHEWSKSFSHEIECSPDLTRQLQSALNDESAKLGGKRDPVALYKKMVVLLSGFRMR